jgi:hypothetical protein
MTSEAGGEEVVLHVYDLSMGWAKKLSLSVVGKQLDGIWHTGVVVFGTEFFWGGELVTMPAGRTVYGTPTRQVRLGTTHIPRDVVMQFVDGLRPRYTPATYSLLSNNCNSFSNELSVFLTGSPIPPDIVGLPQEFLATPVGAALRPIILRLEEQSRAAYATHPAATPIAPVAAAAAAQPSSAQLPSQFVKEGNLPLVSSQGSTRPFIAKLRSMHKVPDAALAALEAGGSVPFEVVDAALAEWPPEECAPLLFVLRSVATGAEWAARLLLPDRGRLLLASLGRLIAATHRPCSLLALATAANTFASA